MIDVPSDNVSYMSRSDMSRVLQHCSTVVFLPQCLSGHFFSCSEPTTHPTFFSYMVHRLDFAFVEGWAYQACVQHVRPCDCQMLHFPMKRSTRKSVYRLHIFFVFLQISAWLSFSSARSILLVFAIGNDQCFRLFCVDVLTLTRLPQSSWGPRKQQTSTRT